MIPAKSDIKILAVLWATAIIFLLAGNAHSSADPMDAMGINRLDKPIEAPGFTLKDINGEKVSLKDFKGKALFVTFWATW